VVGKKSYLFCKKKVGAIFRLFLAYFENESVVVVEIKVIMPLSSSIPMIEA